MTNSYVFDGVETTIDIDVLTPILYWEGRHETFKAIQESKRLYNDLSNGQREAVVARVRRALEVMHDNVEDWLPDSFNLNETGTALNVSYQLVLTDIEEDEAERALVTSHRIREAAKDLKSLINDLDEEDEALDS